MDRSADRPLRVDAVWDIETEAWDTFVVGALWTPDGGCEVFRDEDSMAGALLALPPGVTAWAHSGGRFDVIWLLDWCHRQGLLDEHAERMRAQIRMSGATISALALAGGPTLRDSYRLVPMSLAKASQIFPGARKAELGLPCVCGKGCKGYCSIRRDMSPEVRAQVETYLVADVESLRDCLRGLMSYAADHQLVIRGTVAGSSWASARRHCDLQVTDWDLRAYRFARRGYYGGRTEVAQTRAERIWNYDRISSYPAALRQPVPCGELRLVLQGKRAAGCLDRRRPGLYDATVEVPEMLAPPLPFRVAERRAYPWGTFRGTWPRPELEHAIACGARVKEVHAALVWAREEALLRPYVEHVWGLRAAALAVDEQSKLAAWLKWLANSLTGAFAQDPEQDLFCIGDRADDVEWSSVGARPWLWTRAVFKIADRAHVQFASYLTGHARVELHEQILSAGDAWVYSDTDSVKATRALVRALGAELGEWKDEGQGTDWEAIAPKVYRYTKADGTVLARAKGIPDALASWPQLVAGERVALDSGVKSFLTAARQGGALFVRNDTSRKLAAPTKWCGARLRDGDRTRAPSVAELAELPR